MIVCEGRKTEPNYFKATRTELKLTSVEVEVVGEGEAPINVVNTALERVADQRRAAARSAVEGEYDSVWCVMDVEAPTPHESLSRAIDRAGANKLSVALSNPCFEYWYLLHFERTSALMPTNGHVIRALKKHFPSYAKSDSAILRELSSRTETAIDNAEAALREKHCGEDLRQHNPSTHVHRLVAKLRTVGTKP
ncbi:MAG TPA: RloB family protein [Phycisphaerae bacterium]|nr:RloB family protein [Phycisphaerae bacterium]HUU59140.1 RloB family protein [Phycisphaerae bacterium]